MTRSWWGWGNVEDAVDGAELRTLLGRARLLTSGGLVAHHPPDIASLGLRRSRVTPPAALNALCDDDPHDRAAHAHGKAFRDIVRNLHGDLRHVPDLVARPRSEQDLLDLLDWCGREGIAVVPYGGGTSVVGGIEPRFDTEQAVVTVDLTRLDRVLEVDRVSRAARIQAGVLGPSLEAQLRPSGLRLRHFPESFEFSTLGGWLATRAGGHCATLCTHIDELVESVRVVAPGGISASRRLPASGAGPSPDRLFLGSEGALGIITEAWMRLQVRPRWRAGASLRFADYTAAVRATRAISRSGLHPAYCRLLDPMEALISTGASVAGGALHLSFESADHPVDDLLHRAVELCRDHSGQLSPESDGGQDDDGEAWRSPFLRMPYHRDALVRHTLIVETVETACTWDRFEELHAAVTATARRTIRQVTGQEGVVTCRFTQLYPDGVAPCFGIYAPGRWGSMVAQWDEIKAAVSDAILEHGGTISHHRAVGRDHRPWYDRQRPEPFAVALAAAKKALDPAGILNPGVLLAP